mgnify:CR=1 FL=1
MEINIDYRKYLKRNPGVILEKMPRSMLKDKEYRVVYLRDQGLKYREIADICGQTRQNIEIIMNRVVVRYMEYRNMDTSNVGNYR